MAVRSVRAADQYHGPFYRHVLLFLVLEGKVAGKRQIGKRRLNFMEGGGWGLASAVGCGAVNVLRRAADQAVSGKW